MTDYIDSLRSRAANGVAVTLAKSRMTQSDGSVTEYNSICCEYGPHALSFQMQNDLEADARTVNDWWEQTARHPLIIN